MAMITYPLNNTEYTAEDAELYNSTRTSGVYSGLDFDWSLTGEDNNITVGKGLAWIKNSDFSGKVVAHKEPETFDFGIAPISFGRIDVMAIRFSSVDNSTSLVIKKGSEDGTFKIPERSTTEGVYELYIFSVRRNAGASQITASDISDLRDDRNYCGYMSEAVKDGYAPSLMEHNIGADFRFWVGTEEEYKQKKDTLPPNTFCITVDGSGAEDFVPSNIPNMGVFDTEVALEKALYDHLVGMKTLSTKRLAFLVKSIAGANTSSHSWVCCIYKWSSDYAVVTAESSYGGGTTRITKALVNGQWQPFEWENPPMFENVEYRTSERWNGKAVYTKLFPVQIGPDEYSKEFYLIGYEDGGAPVHIRHNAVYADGGSFAPYSPEVSDSYSYLYFDGETGSFFYERGRGLTGAKTLYVQCWYFKNFD